MVFEKKARKKHCACSPKLPNNQRTDDNQRECTEQLSFTQIKIIEMNKKTIQMLSVLAGEERDGLDVARNALEPLQLYKVCAFPIYERPI